MTTMNITLIGMAGVGKSVVGKELAKRLKCRFIDTDDLIEGTWNLRLQNIIDRFGEQRFLEIEEETILTLYPLDGAVIAPGGSVIYSEKAMKFLKEISMIIFLDAPIESIQKRIPDQERRGIVGLKRRDLKTLFDERRSLYQKHADEMIQICESLSCEEIAEKIIKKILPPSLSRTGRG